MESVLAKLIVKMRYLSSDSYLQPEFLRGFSGLLHLVLFSVLFVTWLWKRIRVDDSDMNEGVKKKWRNSMFFRMTMFCCLGISGFSVFMCCLNYFYWYRNEWLDEKLVTLLDLGLKTLGWLGISLYLHAKFSNHGKLSFLLRIWWGFYFGSSLCCLVMDAVSYRKAGVLPIQFLLSDVFSLITGLFFCYVGIWGNDNVENTPLEEPLLDASGNDEVSNRPIPGDTITPYADAGIFSILTFAWVGNLIALVLDKFPKCDQQRVEFARRTNYHRNR